MKCEIKDCACCEYPCKHCDESPDEADTLELMKMLADSITIIGNTVLDLQEKVSKLERQSWM